MKTDRKTKPMRVLKKPIKGTHLSRPGRKTPEKKLNEPAARIRTASKKITGNSQDTLAREQAEEKLRERERQLITALSSMRMSVWEWDPHTDKITWAPELFEITGLERDKPGQITDPFTDPFTDLLHPGDAARLIASAKKALAEQSMFAEEFRILGPDGRTRWFSSLGHLDHDPNRKTYQVIGMLQDITERKQAEEKLRESEEKYRFLFESNPMPMWIYEIG